MILYCKVTHNPTNSLHFCNIAEQDNPPSLLTLQGCRTNKNALPRNSYFSASSMDTAS